MGFPRARFPPPPRPWDSQCTLVALGSSTPVSDLADSVWITLDHFTALTGVRRRSHPGLGSRTPAPQQARLGHQVAGAVPFIVSGALNHSFGLGPLTSSVGSTMMWVVHLPSQHPVQHLLPDSAGMAERGGKSRREAFHSLSLVWVVLKERAAQAAMDRAHVYPCLASGGRAGVLLPWWDPGLFPDSRS